MRNDVVLQVGSSSSHTLSLGDMAESNSGAAYEGWMSISSLYDWAKLRQSANIWRISWAVEVVVVVVVVAVVVVVVVEVVVVVVVVAIAVVF